LSSSQQRMWFLDQWEPGSPANNGARAVQLRGNLDVAALERALRAVVERHAILRTVYVLEGREPRQIQLASWSLDLPVVDLASVEPEDRELELERLMRAESRCGFDLSRDLMIRPTLFRLGPAEHVLLLAIHHIAFEVKDWAEIQRACEWLAKNNIHLVWGPGRHIIGHNVAIYHRNADKVRVEFFCEMDLMKDEALGYFDPRPWHQDRPQRPKVWGPDTLRNYWGFGSERIIRGYQTVE